MHDFPLITTLAAGFTAAWFLGLITQKFGLSPIVGYLLAGILIGPYTPGFVGDVHLAPQLAELGVILLMFGVGLHFHFQDLLAVKSIAIPGAIGQSLVATLAGAALFSLFGWPISTGLVTGMAMAVASTVVLLRVLMDSGRLNSPAGHAAVGWLIVEDIITVIILVIIPAVASSVATPHAETVVPESQGVFWSLTFALGKLAIFIALISVAGSKFVPWILVQVARLKSRELFTLTVLVLSIAVATGSAIVFGASVALGAFLAGMVVAQSPVSQQAGADALPMRDAFAVLFFVSVGMLFDPRFIIDHPLLVIAGLGIVLVAKPIAALVIVAALGYPARTALTAAAGLAQIGEFSFILGDLAFKHALLSEDGRHLLVACALVSITINPILFQVLDPFERWVQKSPFLWSLLNGRSERRIAQGNAESIAHVKQVSGPLAIVVGYGAVGQQVDRLLREANYETVIIDLDMDKVGALISQGRTAIYGDATRPELLEQAGAAKATHVILTTTSASDRQSLISTAKAFNPTVRILLRVRYLREEPEVLQLGADATTVDEVESAVALSELVLEETGANPSRMRSEMVRVRFELSALDRPSHC